MKNSIKLFDYYLRAAIYPSIFVLFYSLITSLLNNYIYQNEWSLAKSVIIISTIPTLIFVLILCGFSLTLFLNKIKKIHDNLIWNIITWFLLPGTYFVFIFVNNLTDRFKHDFGFGEDFIYLLIMIIPFVIGLFLTFVSYRKKVNAIR